MRFARKLCAQALAASCSVALVSGTAHADPAQYNLLRLLTVTKSVSAKPGPRPLSGYVRFWVERVDDVCLPSGQVEARDYRPEKRDWLTRLLWGRTYSRILQAKLTVTRSHVVTQSVTLASASQASSGHEGESWTTELGDRQFLTPYFRVDQGATAAIDVSLSVTKEAESNVTKNVLAIVQAGAKLAAPTGPLVTSLNSDRLNQASTFIDNAVSRLFHEKIDEKSASDFPIESWLIPAATAPTAATAACRHERLPVATIQGQFPMGNTVWNSAGYHTIGTWQIYVTEPIVSIFSDVPLSVSDPAATAPRKQASSTGDADDECLTWVEESDEAQAGRVESPPAPKKHQGRSSTSPPGTTKPPTVTVKALRGSDRQACLAFKGLAPTRVLNLAVDEKVTLGDALRANPGISSAVQRYAGLDKESDIKGAKASTRDIIGREICNLIAERAETIGLNQWDSAAAVWAFAWNGGLDQTLAKSIWDSGCLTAKLGKKVHLTNIVSGTGETAPPGAP